MGVVTIDDGAGKCPEEIENVFFQNVGPTNLLVPFNRTTWTLLNLQIAESEID